MRCLIFLLFLFNFHNYSEAKRFNETELVFAQVIFRHGDRTPYKAFPNDSWKDSWLEGFGQLTKLGMQQEHKLGQYFRKRYNALLPTGVYPNKLVYCRSTDRERTLMSAAALLAGLFPPTFDQIWNENINWQPIPIHTVPSHMDHVLDTKRKCDRHKILMKKHYSRPEYLEWHKKYDWLYQYVAEKSGISAEDDPKYFSIVNDNLKIQRLYNKTLPEWSVNIIDDMEKLSKFEKINEIGTREMSRLRSGFLLGEIIERFNSKINGILKPNRNLWLYSAHDTTIQNFFNNLGLLNLDSERPVYAASVLIELYRHENQYFIQIYYKNSDNENVPVLNIPNCGTLCPLEKFYEIFKSSIPVNDFETECKVN